MPVSDLFCGLYATIAILAALNHRHTTGAGQYIDASLFDTQVALMSNQAMNYLVGGVVPYLRFPIRLSATPASCRRAPPRFAQDTKAVLRTQCKLSDEEIRKLVEAGVIKINE